MPLAKKLNKYKYLALVAEGIYHNNFKIIAEYTKVKNLDWGSPTEEYMYQISGFDQLNKTNDYIFGSVFHRLSCHYHILNSCGDSIIVIRDHRFDRFDIKSNWIAINPDLARYLGWQLEPSRLFAWKNSNGELMAESIYWSNGNIHKYSRNDSEVGEGWFVIVSETAFMEINSVEENLYLHKKLERSKYEDSNFDSNKVFKIKKII